MSVLSTEHWVYEKVSTVLCLGTVSRCFWYLSPYKFLSEHNLQFLQGAFVSWWWWVRSLKDTFKKKELTKRQLFVLYSLFFCITHLIKLVAVTQLTIQFVLFDTSCWVKRYWYVPVFDACYALDTSSSLSLSLGLLCVLTTTLSF